MRKLTSATCFNWIRTAALLAFALAANAAWAQPSFTSTPVTAAQEDTAYGYDITTTDTSVGLRIVSAPTLPSWLQLVNVNPVAGTARLQGTPTQRSEERRGGKEGRSRW